MLFAARRALVTVPQCRRAVAASRRHASAAAFADGCEHPRGSELYFAALGGCEEIGLNANLYHTEGQWLMVDLGNKMPAAHMTPGLDLLLPDVSFLAARRDTLAGLVITHGHEDHIGGIQYLWPQLRCPIYATRFAANLAQAKLKDLDFRDEIDWRIVEPKGTRQIGPFSVTWHPMAHSIPESNAIVLRTKAGTVFHTGDWKFDAAPMLGDPTDYKALKDLGNEGIMAVVGDSTNARHEGHSRSEGALRDNFMDMFQKVQTKGSIIVTCFSSNIARLETIAQAAEASGRMSGLLGRSMEINTEIAKDSGFLSQFDKPGPEQTQLLSVDDLVARAPPEKRVILSTGCQGEPRSALQRISEGQHNKVALGPEDTVIFAASVIPDNDSTVYSLKARLRRLGVTIIENGPTHFTHVSGHPLRDELRELYAMLQPKVVVPVHGRPEHLKDHADLAKAAVQGTKSHVPRNGRVYRISNDGVEEITAIHTGLLGLEGGVLRPVTAEEVARPEAVKLRGHCLVSLMLDSNGALVGKPTVTLQGFDAPPALVAELAQLVETIVAQGSNGTTNAAAQGPARTALRDRVQAHVFGTTGLTPVTQLFVHMAKK